MNYHNDEWIMQGLERHYQEALKFYPQNQIFAVILRGSQNYGLDTEKSDIDSRCIYIPNQDQLNNEATMQEYMLPNNEQITFIDIRLFTHGLTIRSLYNIELLYSKWVIIPNKKYDKIWQQYTLIANDLMSSNKPAAVQSIHFYMDKKKELLFNNFYPINFEEDVKRGYSNKAFYHIIRYHLLLELLNSDEPFEKCMSEELNSKTLFAKQGFMPVDNVRWLMVSLPNDMMNLEKEIIKNYPIQQELSDNLDKKLLDLEYQVINGE